MGGVGVAQQGEGTALGDDRLPLGGDLVERLVPGDRLELAGTLGSGALERRLDALGGVNEVGVAVHFSAVKKLDVVFIAMLGMVVATIAVALAQIIQFRRGA